MKGPMYSETCHISSLLKLNFWSQNLPRTGLAEATLSDNLKEVVTKDKDLDVPLLLDMLNNIVGKSENEVNHFSL